MPPLKEPAADKNYLDVPVYLLFLISQSMQNWRVRGQKSPAWRVQGSGANWKKEGELHSCMKYLFSSWWVWLEESSWGGGGNHCLFKCPYTASKAKALAAISRNPNLVVTLTGTQALTSESHRPQGTPGLATRETLVRRTAVQPRPKSPSNTSWEQHKETCA